MRTLFCVLLAVALCLVAAGASAQAASSADVPVESPSLDVGPIPAEARAVPLNPDAATSAYLATVPKDKKAASDAYFEGGYGLQVLEFLFGSALALALLHTGFSARMRRLASRVTRVRFVHTAVYWVQYVVLTAIVGFPLRVYEGYFREHAYGLSSMSFGAWMGDEAKGLLVGLVVGAIFAPVLYAILRRATRTWWLWGAGVTLAFATLAVAVGPVFIEPVFNKYTVVQDARVKDPILALARGNGIQTDHVYQFDASRQTNRVSANVAGFLGTQRIALNDNLLRRCTMPEVEAVMGHEMGHYVLNHVPKFLFFLGAVLVIGFAAVRATFDRLRLRYAKRWNVEGVDDPAGLPLLTLLFGAFLFLLTPVLNTVTRTQETEADIFGLNTARQPDGMAAVSLKLGEYRKLDPGPLEEMVFFDHPSGRNRIHMAMQWKAEHIGNTPLQPLR